MCRLLAVLVLILAMEGVARSQAVNPSTPVRRPASRVQSNDPLVWLKDPRSAVLITLVSALLIGGGLKAKAALRAKRLVRRLDEPDVTVEEIEQAGKIGREGLIDLFRLLGTAEDAKSREAAGRAIAALWFQDNLIAEEEKALIRRGFQVDWTARRRYPRELRVPVPIEVTFGVPFLRDTAGEVSPNELAWSYRIMGAERASLEKFSPWTWGRGKARFEINPSDFTTNGPHRLVFESKVTLRDYTDRASSTESKLKALTAPWDLDLPHVPFQFELDPLLKVDALLALEDDARAAIFASCVMLGLGSIDPENPRYLTLTNELVLKDAPEVQCATPLPCDLAHTIEVEFEGVIGRFAAGEIVLSGQGAKGESKNVGFGLNSLAQLPEGSIERPGEIKLRVILTAAPQLGWADPDVRSIWPGSIVTDWMAVRIVRR